MISNFYARTSIRRWVAIGLFAGFGGIAAAQDQQLVTPVPASIEATTGDRITATVEYSTSTGVANLTGLGLRMHWSSSALSLQALRSILANGLVAQGTAEPDSADFDGDPATDTFIQVAWADLAGSWPGGASADLFTVDFDVLAGFSGSTRVGFSASSAAVGHTLGATALRIAEPGGTGCGSDGETLCLGDGRFEVSVDWRDFAGVSGRGKVVPVSSTNSGLFWFFDADNWEMLVKVLDGCGFNGNFWVFAAATTNVEFTLTVRDTQTGLVTVYENELGVLAPAIADIDALPVCSGSDGVLAEGAGRLKEPERVPTGVPQRLARPAGKMENCIGDGETLCLNGGRFQVRGSWRDFANDTGSAQVVDLPVVADDSGLLWFFGPNNWELLIKIIDGCSFNERYWVFSAATTNIEYSLEVTDTLTGTIKAYTNALGTAAPAVADIEAFATCP